MLIINNIISFCHCKFGWANYFCTSCILNVLKVIGLCAWMALLLLCVPGQLCILVAGALGGRFDHEAGNINVLYKFSTMRIILLSDDCLIYLLPKTHRHEIYIQYSVEGPHCGLIPIGSPSGRTSTTGLQWDLGEYIANTLFHTFLLCAGLKWWVPDRSSFRLIW